MPESRAAAEHRGFDLAGAASVTAGLVVLVYGIVKAQEYGWTSARTIGLLALAAALIAAFVAIERRAKAPLVRLGIFRTRSLAAGNGVMLVVSGGMFAVFYFATLYVQEILHLSPVQAGAGFLPLTAAIIAASAAAQQLIARFGVRSIALVGMTTAAVGLVLLSRAPADGTYLANVFPGLVVMGFGLGFTFVPMTLIATTNVAYRDAGLASGLFNTSQQIGGALGLAILSTLAANQTADQLAGAGHVPTPGDVSNALVAGYHVGFLVGAALMLLGAGAAAALLRNRDLTSIDETQTETPRTPSPSSSRSWRARRGEDGGSVLPFRSRTNRPARRRTPWLTTTRRSISTSPPTPTRTLPRPTGMRSSNSPMTG